MTIYCVWLRGLSIPPGCPEENLMYTTESRLTAEVKTHELELQFPNADVYTTEEYLTRDTE